jgi:hypothetical protein
MSHYCPNCQRVLYNRRLTHCGFCGAPIIQSLRFTPEQIAALDRAMAELEEQRKRRERAAAVADAEAARRRHAAAAGASASATFS